MPAFLIPLIIAAVGAGAAYLKQRAANKSVEEQHALYNQWLIDRQKGTSALIDKLTGAGFDPFGAQISTNTGKSLSNSVTNMLTQSKTTPFVTPEYKQLEGQAKGILESRLARPDALPPGYIERSVAGINQAHAGADAAARNMAARKGLSGEQALALSMPANSSRAGHIGDFLATVPLKERELQDRDVAMAADLTRVFGLGSDSVSKTTGNTSTVGSSSNTLSTPPNLGALANLLLPPGPNAGQQTGMSTVGQVGGDLASIMAWLWSTGAFNKGGGRAPGEGTVN
jgi:hypothetical protein